MRRDHKKPWRSGHDLGLKVNVDTVGWAVIGKAEPVAEGEMDGNDAETIAKAMRQHPNSPRGVRLYTYTALSFGRSRAAAEGATLEQHTTLVQRRAGELRAMGIDVEIEHVTI